MFNLPALTAALIVAFPVFWIGYTVAFLWKTRSWDRETAKRDGDAS